MMTKRNLVFKLLIAVLALVGVYLSSFTHQKYLSATFISIAFAASFFNFNKTFPFFILGFGAYWIASMQDLWGEGQHLNPLSKLLWTSGDVLICIGFIYSIVQTIFPEKFKEENE